MKLELKVELERLVMNAAVAAVFDTRRALFDCDTMCFESEPWSRYGFQYCSLFSIDPTSRMLGNIRQSSVTLRPPKYLEMLNTERCALFGPDFRLRSDFPRTFVMPDGAGNRPPKDDDLLDLRELTDHEESEMLRWALSINERLNARLPSDREPYCLVAHSAFSNLEELGIKPMGMVGSYCLVTAPDRVLAECLGYIPLVPK